ncbi:flagellin-like protein [Haloarcula quadrata]|uniref:Flagellin-like protein n=1 Tax=Haloarcula quadrata TaxID=182779 RepID=A0A495R3A0_9EURY|nr:MULTISPECIES: type IV pilin N-terminal domain-containing protein [Haloarcula]NHN61920.1 type IV pilin [Haloarcula sp. JP-Z28]RKS81811.1 flagellin-like protein [Haloarcula quadrata]
MRRLVPGPRTGRGVSPVIGTVLLVAILVVLSAVSAAFVLGLTGEQDPVPQAKLALEQTEAAGEYHLVHESGDTIDGDRLTLRGVANPDILAGTELAAGKAVTIEPQADTVRVVWTEREGAPSSYVLTTFNPDFVAGALPTGTVFTGSSGGVRQIIGATGDTMVLSTSSEPTALGPATDIDNDGTIEVPYTTSGGAVKIVDTDGTVETVTTSIPSGSGIDTDKTRLASGTWGGCTGVFFAGDDDDIYCSTVGGSTTHIADPGDGGTAILGVGDIDADGDDEFVFADASAQLQYYDSPGGSPTAIGPTLGASTGMGAGTLGDFDGDGQSRVAVVDGGNDIHMVDAGSDKKIESGDTVSGTAPSAKQSSAAAADIDDDGVGELVYIGDSSGNLKYIDNIDQPSGNWERKFLTDDGGSQIDGDVETGAV